MMQSRTVSPIGQRAFTLIELLVVMAIISLLLAIASPRFVGSLRKSKDVALAQDLQVMRDSLDKFVGDKGRYPETLDELVREHYLRSIPVDPVTDSAATWVLVPSTDADVPGIVDVKSGASGQTYEGRAYESL